MATNLNYVGPFPPIPSTAQPTITGNAGQVRFNTTSNQLEMHTGQGWTVITDGYEAFELELGNGTVYGIDYVTIRPRGFFSKGYTWDDMQTWCTETFGPTTPDGVWTPHQRWYMNDTKFWFKDIKDRDWFMLRWV